MKLITKVCSDTLKYNHDHLLTIQMFDVVLQYFIDAVLLIVLIVVEVYSFLFCSEYVSILITF